MNSIEQQLKERDKEEKDRYYPFFADCRNDHPIQSKMVDVSRLFSNRRNKSNGFHRKKDLIQTSQTELTNRIQTLQSDLLLSKQREVECLEEMKQMKKEHDVAIKSLHTTLRDMKEQQLEVESLRDSMNRYQGILRQKEEEKLALKQELVKLRVGIEGDYHSGCVG